MCKLQEEAMDRNDEMTERRVADRRAAPQVDAVQAVPERWMASFGAEVMECKTPGLNLIALKVSQREFQLYHNEFLYLLAQMQRVASALVSPSPAVPPKPVAPKKRVSFSDYWWEAKHDKLPSVQDVARYAWDFALKHGAPTCGPVAPLAQPTDTTAGE